MKTYISDSLISEALILLQAMKQNDCFSVDQVENIKTYYGINKTAALQLAHQCEWLLVIDESTYKLTSYGERLLSSFYDMQISENLYREILFHYIVTCKPIWARRIPYGRNEAYRIMSDEEQACIRKAGLMKDPVSRDEVDWWDALAEIQRAEIEHQKDDVGREGEELTIEYEKSRTKANPIWESVNSNLAGFDIISQVSSADASQILIEVKSSSKTLDSASFFVTHHEWDFASSGYNKNRYYFYLWLLGSTNHLAIVPSSEIKKHIPLESGQGEWSETIIPFSAFKDSFVEIHKQADT